MLLRLTNFKRWPSYTQCASFNFNNTPCLKLLCVANLLHFRLRLKCDGTRAEIRFRLSAKRTSPFKSAGASVQSTTGSRCVRISGTNAGYTMFRGSEKGTGYPLHSRQFPLHFPPARHRVPSHFNWTLSHYGSEAGF
jgi:hypothetical protein